MRHFWSISQRGNGQFWEGDISFESQKCPLQILFGKFYEIHHL
jgi:hypothetical protein